MERTEGTSGSEPRVAQVARLLLVLVLAAYLMPSTARAAPWNPLARPQAQSGTLYLLDGNAERKLAPGQGGLIASQSGSSPFSSGFSVAPGRFRRGLTNRGPGWAWMPAEGMIAADQFTVELWLRSKVPWSAISNEVPFAVSDASGSVGLFVIVNKGDLETRFVQSQRSGNATSTNLITRENVPGQKWTEVAVTFRNGVLQLYVNGRAVAKRSGVVGPEVWSDSATGDGISLLGARGYGPSVDLEVSDLRISRDALRPHQRPLTGSDSVTVTGMPSGAVVQHGLLGVLHTLGDPPNTAVSQQVGSNLAVVRTDKLLVATPIVAGPPDLAHPSAGVSGKFSYDWQVVDRALAYIRGLGATPYLSIDASPLILGGSVPPFSGSQLLMGYPYQSNYPVEVPGDMSEYATIVRDLVHHIVVQDGIDVPYWGVWNEPDYAGFWKGTLNQYVQMYAAVAAAVKSVSPSLNVGGPEVSGTTTGTPSSFFLGFLRAVAQQHLPLDFVSFHHYSGSLGNLFATRRIIDATLHRPNLPLVVGEWGWQIANTPVVGALPWRKLNYWANDWGAAFDAASLIDMQRIGAIKGVYIGGQATNAAPYGLATPTEPEVTLNVYRMWSQLGSQVLNTSGTSGPGTTLLASRDASGRVYVLVSHLRYRPDLSEHLRLTIQGVPPNATVARFEVDNQHGDYVDGGAARAQLTTVPSPALNAGTITVTLPPRAVTLLEIGPT